MVSSKVRYTWLLSVVHAEIAGRLAELRVRSNAILRAIIVGHGELVQIALPRWHWMKGNHLWRRLLLLVDQSMSTVDWTAAYVKICHLPVHSLPTRKVLTSCAIVQGINIVVHERAVMRQV